MSYLTSWTSGDPSAEAPRQELRHSPRLSGPWTPKTKRLSNSSKTSESSTPLYRMCGLTGKQKTIEAHQSRVQHLQEKFLQDIQKAGKLEGERVEAELRQRFAIDRDEALRELKQKMHQEASQTQDRLVHQIDSLKLSVERSNIELQRKCQNIEEEWARKYGSLAEQLQAQRTSHAAEMQELQYKLTEASERVPTLSSVAEDEFRTQLAKRDAEIAFLKNTVRIECEERMELIAAVDTLKKKFNGIIVPGTEGLQANLRTGPHQRLPAIDGSSPRPDPAETIGPSRSMPELGAVHPALSASSPSPPAFPRPELPLPPQPSQPPQSKSDSERLFERKAHVASVKKLAKMAKLPKK
ncbi:uncharacterized protein BJ171DRAFT_89730 [Polychytrium aggregatum]|uniref:uncharacterized protein n=1 Tax=Polychytrium aggregatum TaxID=110093 RepID=UPI0022FF4409|nr:uncharacterized protein BJ171DRAFT_89730 [Polychytrium aggregatum]KAI9204795.1 hypothetical protein BJ171DRAFT_89730 [Polychytrium aggregatum]